MRALRWVLFVAAAASLLRFVFFRHDSAAALAVAAVLGGAWLWLQRRAMRALDGPRRE